MTSTVHKRLVKEGYGRDHEEYEARFVFPMMIDVRKKM
jgi:hypothetical protein